MTIHTITFVIPPQFQPDADDLVQVFAFSDKNEAIQFSSHMKDLYGIHTVWLTDQIHTYDSAIQAVVEAIGPSPD